MFRYDDAPSLIFFSLPFLSSLFFVGSSSLRGFCYLTPHSSSTHFLPHLPPSLPSLTLSPSLSLCLFAAEWTYAQMRKGAIKLHISTGGSGSITDPLLFRQEETNY